MTKTPETPDHVIAKRAILEALPPHACVENPFPFGWHAFWTTPAGLWDIRRNGFTGAVAILGPNTEVTLGNPSADAMLATLRLHGGLTAEAPTPTRPHIVVLCGSTRFSHAFREANLRETLAGRIVLSIGCDMRSDGELLADLDDAGRAKVKADLDELHKRKIDLADEVLVLNVGGYVGDSTRSEIAYAQKLGKVIRWLEPAAEANRLLDLVKARSTGPTVTGMDGSVYAQPAAPGSIRQTDGTEASDPAQDRPDVPSPALWRTYTGGEWDSVTKISCSTIANGYLIDADGDPIHEDHPEIAKEIARRGGTYRDHAYGQPPVFGCDHSWLPDPEPFVEVLQEHEKPICGDPHHRHTGPCEVYAPLTPCGCGPTHAEDCPMGLGTH